MKINDTMRALEAAATDWRKVLWNPSFLRVDNEIRWVNFHPDPFNDPTSTEGLAKLRDSGQYSFLVADGSVIQIQYGFDSGGDSLCSARLAFYRQPDGLSDLGLRDGGLREYDVSPIEESEKPVEWIRLDFDPVAVRAFVHPAVHFHASGLSDARITVCGVPTPRQFIEFLMLTFYPSIFAERRIDVAGRIKPGDYGRRINGQPMLENADLPALLHFMVPVHR